MRDGGRDGGEAHDSFRIHAARVGPIKLGSTTVTIDDETLVVVASMTDERSTRVRLTAIDAVHVVEQELTIELHDGSHLRIHGDRLTELRNAVLENCRAVPEVTRALRAFGSRRGQRGSRSTGSDEQHRFFAPLLLARRAASLAAGPADVIAAFDADTLARAFTATLHKFAEERFRDSPPAQRALGAELTDLSEPLLAALEALRGAARSAASELENLRYWREWAAALRAAFESADRAWIALDAALDAVHVRLPAAPEATRGGARTPTSLPRGRSRRRPE